MLTREQLLGLATIIREETAQGLNTAQRVGHLLYEIASSFLLKTQDDHTENRLSADELEAVERLIVVGTQLVGQNNTALEDIVSTIHGSQLVEGNHTTNGTTQNKGDTIFGPSFVSGLLGRGGFIGPDGAAELKSLVLREFLEAPEYRFNRVTSIAGNLVQSWCNGTIESVTPLTTSTGYFMLKLEDGEAGSCARGDICMGIFHYGDGHDATKDSDDLKGNVTTMGFTTTYFRVDLCRGTRNKIVYYTLRPHVDPDTHEVLGYYDHPRPFMKFAGYGNFTDVTRQTSIIIAHSYIRMVRNVDNWEFDFRNIALQIGELDGLHEAFKDEGCPDMTGYSAYLNNIYFTGKIEQLSDDAIDSIRDKLKNYNIYISEHVDMITVDDVGNVIGGLWKEETDENNNVFRTYRIHSAITVRNGSTILTKAADGVAATTGKYQLYLQPHGCTCLLVDSTLYITAIENIKDGVAGSPDDAHFDYDLMRDTENCSVDILIDCEGVGTITKQFPITIKHSSQPFVGADLTNQFSAVSWSSKLKRYIGLPIVFDMKMWHNNEVLDIANVSNVSLVSATAGVSLVNGTAPASPASSTIYYTKEIITVNGSKYARVTLTAMSQDLPAVIDIDITSTANYSGIAYERTLRHTVNRSMDTNVYSIVPSVDAVTVNNNNTVNRHISTDKIYCDIVCDSSEDQHYTVALADFASHKLGLYYKYNYLAGSSSVWYPYTSAGVAVDSSIAEVLFELNGINAEGNRDSNVLHDKESVPVIAAGIDGEGVEFVFILQESWSEDSDDPNALPTPTIYDDSDTAAFQLQDHCPYTDALHSDIWTDEPSGVGVNLPYEFYAERKKKNGVWQPFGDVHLWNKFVKDGSSPYLIDLTNENSIVPCDQNGNYSGDLETTKILLLYGSQDVWDWFNISVAATGVSLTNYTVGGTQVPYDSSHVLHPHTMTANTATVVVTATLKTNSSIVLVATYKLKKSLAGQTTVVYSLVPSVDVVHKLADGTFDNSDSLSIAVKKTTGGSSTLLETAQDISNEGLTIQYQRGSVATLYDISNPATVTPSVCFGTASFITLFLKKSNVVQDRERLNIVEDGEPGEPADHHSIRVVGTNYNGGSESSHLEIDGVTVPTSSSLSRGLTAFIINPVTMEVVRYNSFDVYADPSNGNWSNTEYLMSYLRNYGTSDKVVCLLSYDAVTIDGRLQAFLSNLYGIGQDLVIKEKRRSIAIICQRGLQTGQATVVQTDSGDAVALGTVSCGQLISLASDRAKTSPSILKGANFQLLSAWKRRNGTVVKEDFEGSNAYRIVSPSSGSIEGLEQVLANINSGPLKPDTWYTLSFYGRGGQIRSYLYPSVIDTMVSAYIDGEEITSPAGDAYKDWTFETDIYKRHTYTFKTLPKLTLKGSYNPSTSYKRQEIASVYLRDDGSYSESQTYYLGDIVLYGSYYYYSKGNNHYGNTPYNGSSYWIRLDGMSASDIGKTWYYVSLANSNSGRDFTNTSYWKKITVDTTTLSTSQQQWREVEYLLFRKYSGYSDTYITQPKLEEGVVATDWELSDKDKTGLTGCHERVFETFTPGQTYYNQENDIVEGIRYVDFYAKEDSSMSSGYKVYMCNETHVAASTFANDIGYWTEVSVNAASAFFKYLIAKNANIKILASAQFTIADTDGSVVAGLANTTVPLWVGSGVPGSAPFHVTRAGALIATMATITGTIYADAGYFKGELQGATGTFAGSLKSNDNKVVLTSTAVSTWGSSYLWRGFAVTNNGLMGGDLATIGARLNVSGYDYGRIALAKRSAGTYNDENVDINIILSASDGSISANSFSVTTGSLTRLNVNTCLRQNSSIVYRTFYKKELTANNTIYDLSPYNGDTQIINSTADGGDNKASVILPQLTDIYSMLGLSEGTNFCVRFMVIANLGSNNFYVYGRNNRKTSSNEYPWNDNKYPLMTHWDNSYWERMELAAGDSMEFLLIYDSSRTATFDGYDTKFTARCINHRN